MTGVKRVRPNPSKFQQWWVLTVRVIAPTLRNGELLIAAGLPAVFTVSFYVPLKQVMSPDVHGMSSYAQFLTPLIAVVAICTVSMSAALRSATDAAKGINRRFGSMPIPVMTPLVARTSANVYRCTIALAIAVLCGHIIGFRFYGGTEHAVGFCLIVLLIGVALSLVADFLGIVSTNPEATPYFVLLPAIILCYLSVGLQPVGQFPEWIQPVVRNQPISQFVYALRALAGDTTHAAGSPTWSVVGPSLAWIIGIIAVAVPLSAFVLSRRR